MVNKTDKLIYEDLVEEHQINSYKHLLDIINVNNEEDIRENFIFRGLKNVDYELIPSALRYDDETEDDEINKFIDSDFILNITQKHEIIHNGKKQTLGQSFTTIDKSNNIVRNRPRDFVSSWGEVQFKKESFVLLEFLDYADKIGLNIPTSTYVRRRIHNHLSYSPKEEYKWPEPDFYEIISLAQHFGLPTRALDWTYDFKIALFFAVEGILDNNKEDCILWAFNYKLFEDNYNPHTDMNPTHESDELTIYRPEYSVNSNLKSQKGLFTFLPTNINEADKKTPFDKVVTDLLISREQPSEHHENMMMYHIGGYKKFPIFNEKIFHKFVISGSLKAKILNDLYKDGYAHENIYPDYKGVVDSIEKRVKLDNIINSK